MKTLLALLLAAAALPARAAASDPLAALMASLSAPLDEKAAGSPGAAAENSARLARIQADLINAAAGFEALRAPEHAAAARKALVDETDPALRPFTKDRDASLNAVYRTLAVVDYTWARRFPNPPCPAADRRQALLQSPDGLFVDPDVGALSPWMARLLGPSSFGSSPEEALDQAGRETKPTPAAYEKMRVRAGAIAAELGAAPAAGRAGLYCERADLYERLGRAHRAESGPIEAGLATPGADAAGAVFLLAAPSASGYDVLGAGFLVKTASGAKFVTDASIARGHKKLYAFARPASDGKLDAPREVVIERSAPGVGAAVGRILDDKSSPALTLADAAPAVDEVVRGLGPLRAAGPWTTTQGLVTKAGAATFATDAVLRADMAGGPVLNEGGQAAGLMIRRGRDATALRPERLREFLGGGTGAVAGPEFLPSRNCGSAAVLTAARPVDEYPWSAPAGALSWDDGAATAKPAVLDLQALFH